MTLCTKKLVFWFIVFLGSCNLLQPWPLTDFDAKYAKTCGSAEGCAFSRINAILGAIFDGTMLNNRDAPLRTPLNRHRRCIKVAYWRGK